MKYEVGNCYKLSFDKTYLRSDGEVMLSVKDNDSQYYPVRPYDYQKDWSDITSDIECYCSKIASDGSVCFEISKESALKYWYESEIGHFHTFIIQNKMRDAKTNAYFFRIKDVYGLEQRFYPNDDTLWHRTEVGDEIILQIESIVPSDSNKNNAYLKLRIHHPDNESNRHAVIHNEGYDIIAEEDDYNEIKMSIVYSASKSAPDITQQMGIIVRSVAGFMNKDGGTIYIGLNDAGEAVRDISRDFPYINSESGDAHTYPENKDGYKNKIISTICRKLGNLAGTLVNIDFDTNNNVTYAIVKINKSSVPIWYDSVGLYVRCDNSTRLLKDNQITSFILKRQADELRRIINQVQISSDNPIDLPETRSSSIPVSVSMPSIAASTTCAWRYISLYSNGEWEFHQRHKEPVKDLICEIPIPKENKNSGKLMIAYEAGYVNAVELRKIIRRNNRLIAEGRYNNGINLDGGNIISAFCVSTGDLVLFEYEDNNMEKVKAHVEDAVHAHNNLNAQGNRMIPKGATLNHCVPIINNGDRTTIDGMGITVRSSYKYDENRFVEKKLLAPIYRELLKRLFEYNTYLMTPKIASFPK